WTRKEAFVKARGTGLQLPLDQFDVALRPDEPASLRATRWDPAEASRWSLVTLAPGEGFVGALAIEGRPPIVTMRKENPPCDEPRIW
ncbi:MAG: 4'-phosphopantetheinyl transferase family protein, partial [Candidatus Binatia bacterium]